MQKLNQTTARAPYPPDRCGLREFIQLAGVSKGTFFSIYRYSPQYAQLLDVQEDRLHRLHFPIAAAKEIARERSRKPVHGNKGRRPRRPCGQCGAALHPRHKECEGCGWHCEQKPDVTVIATGTDRA